MEHLGVLLLGERDGLLGGDDCGFRVGKVGLRAGDSEESESVVAPRTGVTRMDLGPAFVFGENCCFGVIDGLQNYFQYVNGPLSVVNVQ